MHSPQTRIAHWLNALLVLLLLVTGFTIFARQHHIFVPGLSKQATFTLHLATASLFALNGLRYAFDSIRSGGWRRIVHGLPKHFGPLSYEVPQRGVYALVFVGAFVMVLTGAALWFKHQAPWLLAALGGEHIALTAHLTVSFALIAFAGVHVIQVVRAGGATFASMAGFRFYGALRSRLLR